MPTSSTFDTSNQYVKYNINVNVNSQNVGNNTSNVTVTVRFWRTNSGYETYGTGSCYCWIETVGAQTQSVTSSQRITNSGINLFSWTGNIPHNADGKKSIWVSSYININSPLTSNDQGFTAALPTIPRSSSVSGGSGNIGGTSTVSISRASSGFTHILYYSFGSISWRWIASNIGTSYTWTLPNDLYAQIPNANSGSGTLICETYNGGTYIGNSSTSFTAKVVNSNPTFTASNVSYQDTNSGVVAITNNNGHIVRNQSNLQASFTSATAKNAASISKYEITFNGTTQTKTSASTINYGTVNSGNNLTLTVKAIDSRGNSTSVSKTVTIFDWQLPTAIITASRENNYEDQTFLKAETTISSVNSKNALQELKYRYKKTSDTTYSDYIAIENNTQYSVNINKIYAWDFQFVASDKFGSKTYNLTIAKGTPIMFFDNEKLSVGVNCFPVKNESFEINGKTIFDMVYPIGAIYMSVNSIDPATIFGGTWAQLTNRFLVGAGSTYAVNSTGGNASITISTSNMPSHTHSFSATTSNTGSHTHGLPRNNSGSAYREALGYTTSATRAQTTQTDSAGSHTHSVSGTSGSSGSGTAVNILPPYLAVYIWKRTA